MFVREWVIDLVNKLVKGIGLVICLVIIVLVIGVLVVNVGVRGFIIFVG